jgi:hypothetical protein
MGWSASSIVYPNLPTGSASSSRGPSFSWLGWERALGGDPTIQGLYEQSPGPLPGGSGPLTRKPKPGGNTVSPIRTAQLQLGLSAFSPPPSPPSPDLPLRRSPCLALCRHRAPLSTEKAEGGTNDHQILTLAFSRHRMWKWGSHACPFPLPAMARSVRCERGGHMNTQITSRPRRRAKM